MAHTSCGTWPCIVRQLASLSCALTNMTNQIESVGNDIGADCIEPVSSFIDSHHQLYECRFEQNKLESACDDDLMAVVVARHPTLAHVL